ncbi:MAG: TetR family transcriptional regulator [Streptosporangiales bacterium]|nr:TetR family transcriptional regulator [Streptosporangiales bacterium]
MRRSPRSAKRSRYHHGDLRAALIDTAIELLRERGVQGFSLAEASRRLGVAAAAPYRHFADREELLAAVAVRASEALVERLVAGRSELLSPAVDRTG